MAINFSPYSYSASVGSGSPLDVWAYTDNPLAWYFTWSVNYGNCSFYNIASATIRVTGITSIGEYMSLLCTLHGQTGDVLETANFIFHVTAVIAPPSDTWPPTINWIAISSVSESGFRVIAYPTDPSGVESLYYVVWPSVNFNYAATYRSPNVVNDGGIFGLNVSIYNHGGLSGEYTIYAYARDNYGNENTSFNGKGTTVVVPNPVIHAQSISVVSNITVILGTSCQLQAHIEPTNAADTGLNWYSTDNGTLSNTGVLTPSRLGSCTVIIFAHESNNVTNYIYATVIGPTLPVTGIWVEASTPSVRKKVLVNTPTQLQAHVVPSGSNPVIFWYTNSGTISSSGVVTISALGGCTVTVQTQEGLFTGYIYLESVNSLNPRPSNWAWSFNCSANAPMQMTLNAGTTIIAYVMDHTEWNNFTKRINEFRLYKNDGIDNDYSFTQVSADMDFSYQFINQAIYAINGMGFSTPIITSGSNVYGSIFSNFVNQLASIV